jgi:hypothetical protein
LETNLNLHTHSNGKGSTARILIAQKPAFQLNPKIRCHVFVILEKKIFLGKKSEFFSYKIKILG